MTKSCTSLRLAYGLSWLILVLAFFAAGIGLLVPALYRAETAWVVPQNRGQDLVTLMALVVFGLSLRAARRGSPRATLIWLGLLGYLAYTYTGAAFSYRFNELFLIYVALFSGLGAALIAALSGLRVNALRNAFDERVPRRGVAVFLVVMATTLCLLWFSQIIPFFTSGRLPPMIEQADVPTVFVYVLDLGVVVPLALLAVLWLWRDQAWGYVLAGFVLVKAATMGLALLAMTGFSLYAGLAVDPTMSIAWLVLAAAGLAMSWVYFRHCSTVDT